VLTRFKAAFLATLIAGALIAFAPPASAQTTVISCPRGAVTGTTTFSPPLDHTNSSGAGDDVAVSLNMVGCSGKVTGTTSAIFSDGTTGLGNCSAYFGAPAGSITTTGAFHAVWNNGKVSNGVGKIANEPAPDQKMKMSITGGFGFRTGLTTKGKMTIAMLSTSGDCVTTDMASYTFDNTTMLTITQS
jgi:hypothetical protein